MSDERYINITRVLSLIRCGMKWILTIKLLQLLLLFCYFDIFVMCSSCGVHEVTARSLSTGTTTCHHCPNCPPGFGLAVVCGSTITDLTLLRCVPCKEGVNYSDTHDYSMCQPCPHCHPHQEKTGQCTPEKNETVCGKCQSRYYEEITGGKCEECTWCCKDNENQRRMPECIQAGLPANKQCAKSALSESCKPKGSNKEELPTKIIVAVCVIIVPLVSLVIVLVCPTTRRKLKSFFIRVQRRIRSHNRPSEQQQSSGNTERTRMTSVQLQEDENPSASGQQIPGESYGAPNGNCNINRNLGRGPVVSDFNPNLLSGNCADSESKANTSCLPSPSPNGSGNMHEHSAPPRFERGYSHPGYEDENPSASGQQIPGESYGAPNENCNINRNLGRGPVVSDFNPDFLSGNMHEHSAPPRFERGYSHPGYDERDDQPAAPSALSDTHPDRNRTEYAQEVNNVLQDLKKSHQFSENRLKEKTSELPFTVLKDLCLIMNRDRAQFYDDYRLMGHYMGFKNDIIESAGTDPTKTLLTLYGSKFGGTVGHVMAILRIIERDDAFTVLKTYCLKAGSS